MSTSNPEQRYVGSYRLIQCIGDGGMGAVYMAEHQLLGREAAVKVLHPEYSHEQEYVERFFKEAKAAAAISHPGIVKIYDFGYEQDGSAYIAMELLQGEGLDKRIARLGGLPLDQALRFAGQIANVLAAAHDHGIVHRDLKPANLFIVPDPLVAGGERIKILDFGIAKFAVNDDTGLAQTRADAILGSPAYMAPEQIRRSSDADHRADLYAMGCILFEMLCGQPPFGSHGDVMVVIAAQLHDAPPTPSHVRPDVPHDLDSVIAYLLAKEPDHRYASARDLERALAAIAGNTVTSPATSSPFISSPAVAGQGAYPGAAINDDASGPNMVAQTLAGGPFGHQAPGHATSGNAAPTVPGMHGHAMPGPGASQPMTGHTGSRTRSETSGAPSRSRRIVTILGVAAFMIGGGVAGLIITSSNKAEKQSAAPIAEPAPATAPKPAPKPTFTFRALQAPRSRDAAENGHDTPAASASKKRKQRNPTLATEVTVVQPDQREAIASLFDGVDVSYLRTMSRTFVRDLVAIVPVVEPHVTWVIRTEPPGAEVVDIAGRVLGVTPTEAQLDVTPGYTEILTLRLAGHDDKEIQLSGERDFDQLVKLNPRHTISLVSTPPGAEIRNGKGKVVGVTPHDIELSRSDAPVSFSLVLEGYEPATAEIVVDGDKQHEVALQKLRAMVTIRIDSAPQGATVLKDGQKLGKTPLQDRFFEQKGKINYVLELDGYQRKRVRMGGDRDGQTTVKLHRKCSKLSYLHVRC